MVGICLLAGATQLVCPSTPPQENCSTLEGQTSRARSSAIKADPDSLVQCRGPEYGGSSDSVLGMTDWVRDELTKTVSCVKVRAHHMLHEPWGAPRARATCEGEAPHQAVASPPPPGVGAERH